MLLGDLMMLPSDMVLIQEKLQIRSYDYELVIQKISKTRNYSMKRMNRPRRYPMCDRARVNVPPSAISQNLKSFCAERTRAFASTWRCMPRSGEMVSSRAAIWLWRLPSILCHVIQNQRQTAGWFALSEGLCAGGRKALRVWTWEFLNFQSKLEDCWFKFYSIGCRVDKFDMQLRLGCQESKRFGFFWRSDKVDKLQYQVGDVQFTAMVLWLNQLESDESYFHVLLHLA